MSKRESIVLYINSIRHQVTGDAALSPLIHYLRSNGLTSVKNACGTGGCGACTVLLSVYSTPLARIQHRAINACITPITACDGCAITTVEAISNRTKEGLTPLQAALADHHATQCGFCTPGFVMSLFASVREHAAGGEAKPLTEDHIVKCLDGNLCRCTGYRPILDAYKTLLTDDVCSLEDQCCRNQSRPPCAAGQASKPKNEEPEMKRELVFPPELVDFPHVELDIEQRWLRPVTLERMMQLRVRFPRAAIVAGGTELHIQRLSKQDEIFLCVTHVQDMLQLHGTSEGVIIGASVTWKTLEHFIENIVKREADKGSSYRACSLGAVLTQLQWFAGTQIRNVASVGGNVFSSSNSDMNPLWIATGATLRVLDCATRKQRELPARQYFSSQGAESLKKSDILLSVFVPWNESELDMVFPFKVSRRKEHDIAIVSAAIRFKLGFSSADYDEADGVICTIDSISMGVCGIGCNTIAAEEVETAISGKPFDKSTLQDGLEAVKHFSELQERPQCGMKEFRQALAVGFLFKAFIQAAERIGKLLPPLSSSEWDPLLELGLNPTTDLYMRKKGDGSQGVQINVDREAESMHDQTGRAIKDCSANLQVSGEAVYLDDVPRSHNELQAALVLSTEPHATIVSIDYREAEQMPGVCRIVRYEDIRGKNTFGMGCDELCFAKDKVTTLGQVIAVVLAGNLERARKAAKQVKVQYESSPAIVTIEEAIERSSFAPGVPQRTIQREYDNDFFTGASKNKQVITGTARIGAQEHWYMEPQGSIAIPEENEGMTILSSTQSPSKTQETVARVLGVPMHKIVCKVKRLGGGFGGKETRCLFISAVAAVAAQVSGFPVRLVLQREEDMLMTGTGHAFLVKYKASFEPNGRIVALELNAYVNMGNTFDLSVAVLDQALLHSHNCYDIPHAKFTGDICVTHSPSSTAFRGFGAPQGMMAMETVIEHVATATGLSTQIVRDRNLFGKSGRPAVTPYGMSFDAKTAVLCWEEVLKSSSYKERRSAIDSFNESQECRKRGIAVIPTMFGISFSFKPLNQASALVHIYHQDGSVLISHGGVEMGQGLHTKMCQVAATCLEIPLDKVLISDTATDKVPNASPTAASASTDLYGMAVKNACETLIERLKPYRETDGIPATWGEAVHAAWFNRVSLSATGFYKTPMLDIVDLGTPGAKGRPFYYFTNGAAVSEVEVDTLTGETSILRTDIVMDVGRSLNPGIDIGQIEGAFVQGLGWCTMEEVVRGSSNGHTWIDPGKTHTLSLSTYKIPSMSDIPKDFRVRVLETRNEKDTIHSSKGIGEPPFFLSASVFFAIRDAISASRAQSGVSGWFELDSPATVERIRMACMNKSLSHILPEGTVKPTLSL